MIKLPYPISTNRYWRNSKNGTYISDEGKMFKATVQRHYAYIIKPKLHDVELFITIHPKLTKKGIAHKSLIDIDNCGKCVLDSLIGIIYIDDKQVKVLHIRYGEPIDKGGATVEYKYLTE